MHYIRTRVFPIKKLKSSLGMHRCVQIWTLPSLAFDAAFMHGLVVLILVFGFFLRHEMTNESRPFDHVSKRYFIIGPI